MDISLTKEKLKNIYGKVSPFEFKDKLLQLAYLNNNKRMYMEFKLNI